MLHSQVNRWLHSHGIVALCVFRVGERWLTFIGIVVAIVRDQDASCTVLSMIVHVD